MNTIINLFAKIFSTGFFVIKSVLKAHFNLLTVVPDQKAMKNNKEYMGGPFEEKLISSFGSIQRLNDCKLSFALRAQKLFSYVNQQFCIITELSCAFLVLSESFICKCVINVPFSNNLFYLYKSGHRSDLLMINISQRNF